MYADSQKGGSGGLPMDAATAAARLEEVWPRYFPEETELSAAGPKASLAADLAKFFSSQEGSHLLSRVEDDGVVFFLPIDFQQLRKLFMGAVTKLVPALEENPKEALLCMGAAVHLAMCSSKDFQLDDINKINIRLYNHTDMIIALKNLKAAYINKLVTVCGTVVKVSTVKPLVLQLDFQCMKCATSFPRVFCDGKFSHPVSCKILGCKSKTFTPKRSTAKLMDFQKIRIQELASAENHEEGRVPRTIECELTEDLVDCCIPGEIVTVTGIVKVLNNYIDVGGGTISF